MICTNNVFLKSGIAMAAVAAAAVIPTPPHCNVSGIQLLLCAYSYQNIRERW